MGVLEKSRYKIAEGFKLEDGNNGREDE